MISGLLMAGELVKNATGMCSPSGNVFSDRLIRRPLKHTQEEVEKVLACCHRIFQEGFRKYRSIPQAESFGAQ